MKHKLITLAVAACCAYAGIASAAIGKDEYKNRKATIEADYKAAKDKCKALTGNAADICKVEAKGNDKVAMADLEAQYKPSAKMDEKARFAKADAAYELAKEKCDDLTGNAKDVCRKDAKAAHVSAIADAKVAKVSADKGAMSDKAVAERKDAREDKSDAQYAAAKERCEAMTGTAKDGCIADAKKKFGKM